MIRGRITFLHLTRKRKTKKKVTLAAAKRGISKQKRVQNTKEIVESGRTNTTDMGHWKKDGEERKKKANKTFIRQ